jgi:hypothetical protein
MLVVVVVVVMARDMANLSLSSLLLCDVASSDGGVGSGGNNNPLVK